MPLLKPPRPPAYFLGPRLPVFDPLKILKPPAKKELTRKEREALLGACRGYNNREIATAMGTSVPMVKNLLRFAYIKIGVNDGQSSRVAAVLFAIRNGWFNPFSD